MSVRRRQASKQIYVLWRVATAYWVGKCELLALYTVQFVCVYSLDLWHLHALFVYTYNQVPCLFRSADKIGEVFDSVYMCTLMSLDMKDLFRGFCHHIYTSMHNVVFQYTCQYLNTLLYIPVERTHSCWCLLVWNLLSHHSSKIIQLQCVRITIYKYRLFITFLPQRLKILRQPRVDRTFHSSTPESNQVLWTHTRHWLSSLATQDQHSWSVFTLMSQELDNTVSSGCQPASLPQGPSTCC